MHGVEKIERKVKHSKEFIFSATYPFRLRRRPLPLEP